MRWDVLRRGAVIVTLAGAAFLLCLHPSSLPAVSHDTRNAASTNGRDSQLDREERRRSRRRLASQTKPSSTERKSKKRRRRILYIVTSLAEYNSGTRATVANSDRLQETTIPVVTEGIRSMVKGGYDVDLFLVCHYTLKPEREALVRAALPPNVGLEVWNEATPLGYITDKEPFTKLVNRTEHLARQHRFVIKDKVPYYDIFVNFEDDMLITAEHVRHFEAMTEEIARLRDAAPDDPPPSVRSSSDALNSYHGTMTKSQLKRTIPGFIRVEVLLDEEHYPAQSNTGPVPIDLEFGGGRREEVDAAVCCHVSSKTVSEHRPANPKSDQLMLWETHILPLGVRRMPDQSWLDWVVTQRGPNQNKLDKKEIIGDYWTNRKRKFYPKESRPASQEFKFINNQGGWMATREQMFLWHTEICPGGFLPPYEAPHYRFDGLDMRNVEWYSGAMQLSTVRHACNMQRIILLDPKNFSKSLIYHSANNKQRQLTQEGLKERFTKANTLLGQLNTVRKQALADIKNQ